MQLPRWHWCPPWTRVSSNLLCGDTRLPWWPGQPPYAALPLSAGGHCYETWTGRNTTHTHTHTHTDIHTHTHCFLSQFVLGPKLEEIENDSCCFFECNSCKTSCIEARDRKCHFTHSRMSSQAALETEAYTHTHTCMHTHCHLKLNVQDWINCSVLQNMNFSFQALNITIYYTYIPRVMNSNCNAADWNMSI